MQPVQRLEIIADEVEMHKILDLLDQIGVPGYTVIRNVIGRGIAKAKASDDYAITGLGSVYVISYCPAPQMKTVIEELRPVLNKFGGVCYVSDAMEIRSVHCITSV